MSPAFVQDFVHVSEDQVDLQAQVADLLQKPATELEENTIFYGKVNRAKKPEGYGLKVCCYFDNIDDIDVN